MRGPPYTKFEDPADSAGDRPVSAEDVFRLEQELESVTNALDKLKGEHERARIGADGARERAATAERAYAALKSSISWRLTAPLRELGRAWRRLGRWVRGKPIAEQQSATPAATSENAITGAAAASPRKTARHHGKAALDRERREADRSEAAKLAPGANRPDPTSGSDEAITNRPAPGYVGPNDAPILDDPPVRPIAFYLPQFHPIPENDENWGKGFTEWTNVVRGTPKFPGHYQPRLPGDLGFYDLRVPETIRAQVEIAKKFGIYGFCFHFYWFAGTRLLERPIQIFHSEKDIEFPFCINWANENWTRRWDGGDNEVIIGQAHSPEDDLAFIRYVSQYLVDPRYIRIEGKPLLVVYRPGLLPDPKATADRWRGYCRSCGIGEIYLAYTQAAEGEDPAEYGFDAAIEFPPNRRRAYGIERIENERVGADPDFEGKIFDYQGYVQRSRKYLAPPYELFRGLFPSWDNTPRRQKDGVILANSSTAAYKEWLSNAIRDTAARHRHKEKRLLFINAWNEWAEGAHLEPDAAFGYAYLQATAEALAEARAPTPSAVPGAWKILFVSHDAHRGGAQLSLLGILKWLFRHTNIKAYVICLDGGPRLGDFQEVASVALFDRLMEGAEDRATKVERIREFCQGDPDLIYGNTVVSGKVVELLSDLGAPIVTHVRELQSSVTRYAPDVRTDLVAHSTHFIACSAAVAAFLQDDWEVSAERVSVVPTSIEPKQRADHDPDREWKKARRKLGLSVDEVVVVGCGVGTPFRKGADLFIEVASELWQRGHRNIRFVWIGALDKSETHPSLGAWDSHVERLRHSGLGSLVTFLGNRDDVDKILSAADIFLLTSREEPFARSALEAAAAQLPVICFEGGGGIPEFVEQDAGFCVPHGDVKTMADKVALLAEDGALRRKLGARGREKVLASYTVDRMVPQILSLCRRLAGQSPAVSVVVPSYNYRQYLPGRLDSILGQEFRDIELVLLDDGSTDGSAELLRPYAARPDVRVVVNEANSGSPYRQWARGIGMCRGELVWIAEADDTCEPEMLGELVRQFEREEVVLAYCQSKRIDGMGAVTAPDNLQHTNELDGKRWTADFLEVGLRDVVDYAVYRNTIPNASACIFRRSAAEGVEDDLRDAYFCGDRRLYARLLRAGKVAYVARALNGFRRHSGTVTEARTHDERFLSELAGVLQYVGAHFPIHRRQLDRIEDFVDRQYKVRGVARNSQSPVLRKALDALAREAEGRRRIAFVTTNEASYDGGSELWWRECALRLREWGHDVVVLMKRFRPAPPFVERLEAQGIKVLYRGEGGLKWLMAWHPDLVALSLGDQDQGTQYYRAFGKAQIPYVIVNRLTKHPQFAPICQARNEAVREGYLRAERVFFASHDNWKLMEERLGCALPHGGRIFSPSHADRGRAVAYPSVADGFALAVPARIIFIHKGQDLIVDVLKHDKWKRRKLRVNVYGDGPDEARLRELVEENGLNEQIRLCGPIVRVGAEHEIARIWEDNHAVLLPSRMEGFPNMVINAMVSGRLPIITDIGGHREVIEDEVTGFLAAEPSAEALDEALERAYRRRGEWEQIGRRAREAMLAHLPEDPTGDAARQILEAAGVPMGSSVDPAPRRVRSARV